MFLRLRSAAPNVGRMTSGGVEQLQGYLSPLLRSLEGLAFISRHFDPTDSAGLLERVGAPVDDLRAALGSGQWEPPYSALRPQLDEAARQTLAAYDTLGAAAEAPDDLMRAFSALGHLPRALEALYPLAGIIPPVNRFFLDPEAREDTALQQRLFRQPPPENTGVIRLGDDPKARETVWMYVPETYDPASPAPVVFALHGGSGNGRGFLWSWVRAARTRGVIVVAPSSTGPTWAIQGPDADSPRLERLLGFVRETWNVDPTRMALSGMSDGGTFSYTSGLLGGSPFTHLAPVAAAFHPMLAAMADGTRMQGLPIHIIHGEHDWMFPITMAKEARQHLSAAGAAVTWRRLDDLSHTYGPDLSSMILDWLVA